MHNSDDFAFYVDSHGNSKTELLKCYKGILEEHDEYEADNWFDLEYTCNCIGKKNCSMTVLSDDWSLDTSCDTEKTLRVNNAHSSTPNVSIPDPNFMIVAKCATLSIINPMSGKPISKE